MMSLTRHQLVISLALLLLVFNVQSFVVSSPRRCLSSTLFSDTSGVVDDEDDDEEVEPGQMRVTELKSELQLRGVGFEDCFDKDSLVAKLKEARATGKADPSILNDFNKQNLEQSFSGDKLNISDEDIDRIKANDGNLPGGMNPEMMKKLMGNPELMALLQNPKMQEAMQLMMSGGREDLEAAINKDPELQEIIQTLNTVMRGAM